MNDTLFPELAPLRIEMTDEVRDEQFSAIAAALETTPAPSASPIERVRLAWRRWVATAAVIGTGLVPVAAVASESAAPGDLLYPIKLTVERVQVLFDGDIDAEHRVNELETLVEQQSDVAVIENHIVDTLDVLEDTPNRTDLSDRVADALDRYRANDRLSDVVPPDEPQDTDAPISDRTTTTLSDRNVDIPADRAVPTEPTETERNEDTTTTLIADTTTTTEAPRDGAGNDAGGDDRGDAP